MDMLILCDGLFGYGVETGLSALCRSEQLILNKNIEIIMREIIQSTYWLTKAILNLPK